MINLTLTNIKSWAKFRGELSEPFVIKIELRQSELTLSITIQLCFRSDYEEWVKKFPPRIKIGQKIRVTEWFLQYCKWYWQRYKTQIICYAQNIARKIGLKILFNNTEIMPKKLKDVKKKVINKNSKPNVNISEK